MQLLSDKITGSTCFSDDWNQLATEMQNIITSQGIALSNLSLDQAAQAISDYSTQGDLYVQGGTDNALELSVVGSKEPVQSYEDGMRIRFKKVNDSTTAVTVDIESIGVVPLEIYSFIAFTDSITLKDGDFYEMVYSSLATRFFIYLPTITNQPVYGGFKETWSRMESNSGFPDDEVDFFAGATIDSTETRVMISPNRTKSLTDVWSNGGSGGRASGASIAINVTWFCFVISRDNGVSDYGFDNNRSGTNLLIDAAPFDYFYIQCIGAFLVDGTADIFPFTQTQDEFRYTKLNENQYDMVGGILEDNLIGIPDFDGLEPDEALVQVSMISLTPDEDQQGLTLGNPNQDTPTFPPMQQVNRQTDFVAKNTEEINQEAATSGRITIYPNDAGEIRFYPRSEPTAAAGMRITITPISWIISRTDLFV